MRKIILLVSVIFINCNTKTEKLQSDIVILKHKNDSLQNIIDTLNTKYIFDRAYLSSFPIALERTENNENKGFITFVACNKSDTIIYGTKPDRKRTHLTDARILDYGGAVTIKRTENDTLYYYKANKAKYGKNYESFTSYPLKNFP